MDGGTPKEAPRVEVNFSQDLAFAVNQAFDSRRKLSSATDSDQDRRKDSHGIYESTDPRSNRVVVDGNRVAVQTLEDYRALLGVAFGRIYRDPTRVSEIVSEVMAREKRELEKRYSRIEEHRHTVAFIETSDGYPGISTFSFSIQRYVSPSPNAKELNLQPKKKIAFVGVSDPKFQYVVDAGIIPNLRNTDLCWLAGAEMAISPFVPDVQIRDKAMKALVARIKGSGYFNAKGGFNAYKIDYLVDELNTVFAQEDIGVRADFHDNVVLDDLADSLRDGSTVMYSMSHLFNVHALVASEILKEEGKQVYFQVYDPGAHDEIAGKQITDNFTIIRDHERGLRLEPILVSFNRTL